MKYCENILETIGHTPLVKLHRVTAELPCPVFAKVEFFNPGNSIKTAWPCAWWKKRRKRDC